MKPIKKLLVANRGEIASRLIRTAKRMGIRTVAVHSEADARSLHVAEADEFVAIGPAPAKESYLKVEQILAAARDTGADAVHPGYGFLSESADFARACRAAGLVFVGPETAAIEQLGSKLSARRLARAAGVPLLPGSEALGSVEAARAAAAAIGYPVLLKASAGGGGIGMQLVRKPEELDAAFTAARDKAARFFGEPSVYVEKWLEHARHVEVQIAADGFGDVVHLGERECSIQRRHQKVVEETPSSAVDDELRERLAAAALALAREAHYTSLGTVELLLAGRDFYFLEVNTRLQVEHTVTEMVTGLDLVEWQLRIAMGEPLPARQHELRFHGHAIQCRICAENPDKGFLPSPGRIDRFLVPQGPGVRNDVGVTEGDVVTPYYDSLIAKLVVHAPSRAECLERLQRALRDYEVDGVATNLEMHRRVVAHPRFARGDLDTAFLRSELGLKA